MKQRFDAIVVGAGPAGCACDYTLAKAGFRGIGGGEGLESPCFEAHNKAVEN